MITNTIIIERNKHKFSRVLSNLELKLLSKEKIHLLQKQKERELNMWETERLQQLEKEYQLVASRITPHLPNAEYR